MNVLLERAKPISSFFLHSFRYSTTKLQFVTELQSKIPSVYSRFVFPSFKTFIDLVELMNFLEGCFPSKVEIDKYATQLTEAIEQ